MPPSPWSTLAELADQGATFHIIDTETTGLSAQSNRVIELATVSVRHGKIVGRFETFIDPGVRVPSRITEITGIRDAMLVGAPKPAVAFQQWRDYLGADGHFVAHNAGFDWGFLTAEFERADLDWPFTQSLCTVRLARHCFPRLPKHGLGHLIDHFGIVVSDRHRALADTEATADIFLRCLDHLRGVPARTAPPPVAIERQATPAPLVRHIPPVPASTPWDDTIAYVRARSNITAALLTQHATIARHEPDGAVVIRITPIYKGRFDEEHQKRELVEEAVRAVFGGAAHLRLES